MSLKDLWAAAKGTGWAKERWAEGDAVIYIPYFAELAGWTAVSTKAGEGPVSTLRPVSQSEARADTMSAVHGLHAQPLHVDGSHMLRPPDVVVLFSRVPSQTPTRVWKPSPREMDRDAACHGLFLVGTGRSAFLAPVVEIDSSGWKFRYDSVIMKPADDRARKVASYLDAESERQAQEVEWDEANTVLVINNRKALHGRAAVTDANLDRTLVRMAFYAGEANESGL